MIPVVFDLQAKGAESIKSQINELNEAYQKGVLTNEQYLKSYRAIGSESHKLNTIQSQTNKIFLATHPNLNKLTRGMSTFASVGRTMMSVLNTINLSNIASLGISASRAQADADVSQAERELALAIEQHGKNSKEAADAQDKLNVALAKQEEVLKGESEQKLNSLASTALGLATAVSTAITAIGKSEKLTQAIYTAASKLGGMFGSVFSGISSLAMTAGSWIKTALSRLLPSSVAGGAASGAAHGSAFTAVSSAIMSAGAWIKGLFVRMIAPFTIGGTVSGTAFGVAFQIAAIAGLVILAAVATDIITQKIFGKSIIKDLAKKIFGMDIESPLDQIANMFGNKDISKSLLVPPDVHNSEDPTKLLGDTQKKYDPLLDILNKQIPDANAVSSESFNQTWQQDIPQIVNTSSPLVQTGFLNMWNGVIGITNSAGSIMISATNQIFSALISQINSMINAYNNAARKLGRSTISKVTFQALQFQELPTVEAATGFDGIVSSPTHFIAGERGQPESVSISPLSGGSKNNGGGITIVAPLTIQGSVITERELYEGYDEHLKKQLKKLGWKFN